MAQSVERPTLAQVVILRFVGSSPTSGSVLAAQSLEPASGSVSPSLSAPPLFTLFLSKINIHLKKNFFSTFFIYFGDRERQSMNGGGAEREGDTESKAGSRL